MKNKTNFLTSLIVLISLGSFAQIPQDSLLLYYPFDGDAADSSGNGFDGIVQGAVLTTDRFGNPNSAYFFDGTDDFIEMPNIAQLKPQLPISISFWAKLESLSQLDNQFFSTSPVTGNYAGCTFNTTSDGTGGININYGDNNGGANSNYRRTKSASANLNIGIWHHIVGVYRGPLDMDIYIDGVLLNGTYTGSSGLLGYANVPGSIGRANTTSAYHWGTIDDFAIYNKSLDSCEVEALFRGIDCNPLSTPFKIYPNPSEGQFKIENTSDYNLNVIILDNIGRIVSSFNMKNGSQQINIGEIHYQGVYHIIIQNDSGKIWTEKVLIM